MPGRLPKLRGKHVWRVWGRFLQNYHTMVSNLLISPVSKPSTFLSAAIPDLQQQQPKRELLVGNNNVVLFTSIYFYHYQTQFLSLGMIFVGVVVPSPRT